LNIADIRYSILQRLLCGLSRLMLVQHNSPGMADQKFRRVAAAQRNSSKPDVQSLSNRENLNRSLAVPATDVSVAGQSSH